MLWLSHSELCWLVIKPWGSSRAFPDGSPQLTNARKRDQDVPVKHFRPDRRADSVPKILLPFSSCRVRFETLADNNVLGKSFWG